ncbi:MAG: PKD domain-containing protein [Thermoplasmatota archaeon]
MKWSLTLLSFLLLTQGGGAFQLDAPHQISMSWDESFLSLTERVNGGKRTTDGLGGALVDHIEPERPEQYFRGSETRFWSETLAGVQTFYVETATGVLALGQFQPHAVGNTIYGGQIRALNSPDTPVVYTMNETGKWNVYFTNKTLGYAPIWVGTYQGVGHFPPKFDLYQSNQVELVWQQQSASGIQLSFIDPASLAVREIQSSKSPVQLNPLGEWVVFGGQSNYEFYDASTFDSIEVETFGERFGAHIKSTEWSGYSTWTLEGGVLRTMLHVGANNFSIGSKEIIGVTSYGVMLQNATSNGSVFQLDVGPFAVAGPVAFMEPIEATTTRTAITFQDNSTGITPITQFEWNLDGIQKTGEAVQHTFTAPGLREFSHSVTDDAGRESTIRGVVEVTQVGPTACQAFVKTTIQLDEILEYSDCSSHAEASRGAQINGRTWNFGDSSSSSLASGTHQFQATGNYAVALTVTDEQGVQDATTTTITVVPVPNQAPTVSFTASPVNAVHGQESVFTATATDEGSVSYKWFVDGVQRGTSSTLTRALAPGDHVVRVVVQDVEGLEAEASKTVTVAPRAKAIVTVPSRIEFETGSVSFEASIKNPNPVDVAYRVEISGLPVGWDAAGFDLEVASGETREAMVTVDAGTQADRLVKVSVADGVVTAEVEVLFSWLEPAVSSSSSSSTSSSSSSSQSVHATTESKDSSAAFMFGPLLVALALVQLKRRKLQ